MTLALCGAQLFRGDKFVDGMAVLIERGHIVQLIDQWSVPAGVEVRHLEGGFLVPGFIDVQVNGGGGVLFNENPTVESLRVIGAAHRRFGTTGFLPTIISDRPEIIDQAMRAVEEAIVQNIPGVLGMHIEGPMLAPSRHGIHDPQLIRQADDELIDLVSSLRTGRTLVTVAPEIVGSDVIARLVRNGVIVSAGHTEATYEETRAGFAAGVTGATHLFNAMSPMTNRAPGAVGAVLEDNDIWAGIIVDGVHVHPATLRNALRSRPIDRFMLVTDAMSPVGTDASRFRIQGREITVAANKCVDDQGTLAGSNLTMAAAVRNAVDLLGLPLPSALRIAAETPAAFLGMGDVRGTISPGSVADLVWLDDRLNVRASWIAGEVSDEGEA